MVFEWELAFGRVDDVIGHLLVAAEVVTREFSGFAVYLHVGGGINAAGLLVPEEEGSFECFVFQVLDEDSTSQFPKLLLVVKIGGVAGDESIDLIGWIEALNEKTFLEGPVLRVFLVVDVPVFGDDFVADNT